MIDTFPIKLIDGHIIVTINNFDYVVDTGSPLSFGHRTTIVINKKSFPIKDGNMSGITVDSLSRLSGLKMDGLIGMNILIHFDVEISQNQITFSDTPILPTNRSIQLPIIDSVMNIPIISLKIGHENRRIFFDTGAKLSYLSEDLLVGEPFGQMSDFYPSIGTFTTNVYKIDVDINGIVETLTFGCLPSSIRILLEMGQTKGIIGTELLNKYSIILSNLSRTIVLEPFINEESFDQRRIPDNEERVNLVRELILD